MAGSFSFEFNWGSSFDTFRVSIQTSSLPNGQVGVAYDQTLQADVPVTWTIVSGSLPAGLFLNGATGNIFGTPSAAGTSNFTVQAAYAGQGGETAEQALSIQITAATGGWVPVRTSIFSTFFRRFLGFY